MRATVTTVMGLASGLAATSASAVGRPLVAALAARAQSRFAAIDTSRNGSIGFFELIRVSVARVVAKRR